MLLFLNFLFIKSDKYQIRNTCLFKIYCSRSSKQYIIMDWQESEEKQRLIVVPNFNENIQKRSYN